MSLVGMGSGYPWRGGKMHHEYCTEKWTRNGEDGYTGVVVATFLTAVAKHMSADARQQKEGESS